MPWNVKNVQQIALLPMLELSLLPSVLHLPVSGIKVDQIGYVFGV